MRVEDFLTRSAGRLPDKIALVCSGTRLSYDEMDRLSTRFALGLAAQGVKKGDRVLIFLDNCVEAAIAIFGTLKAGAVFSPINASTKAAKLAFIIDNCRAAAVVTKTRMAPVLVEALTRCRTRPVSIVADHGALALPDALNFGTLTATDGSLPAPGPDADLAMLIYTSGSTGNPKGVMMTHANIDAAANSITTYLENVENDIILNVLPLAFDYGLYQLLMAVRLGATLVLESSFAFPQAIFQTMREEKVTGFPIVPTMAAMILKSGGIEPGSFPHLRYITNTAAALPPAHIEQLRVLFTSTTIFSMYGLTECKRCTWLPPARLDDKRGSVGIAIPGTEAYVADEEGDKLPAGITGELMIRGPHVMAGYWENPEATARALRPGLEPGERVLATGDLFLADAEGFLYFVGRKDDIIKTRGEKVAPKEVEAVLLDHPQVLQAIVVGREDAILGQSVCALVIAKDRTLSERELIRHCARRLEDFMVPKSIEFRQTLPTTDTGKLSRRLAAESLT